MTDPITTDEGLIHSVAMTLPPAALEVREALARAMHRSVRGIRVSTAPRERDLYLIVLTGSDDEHSARRHALRHVIAALGELGLAEPAPHVIVGNVTSQPALPGAPHPVEASPPLAYRRAALPDGRVVCAASAGPLGEWFAYVNDDPGHMMAGRSLPELLNKLLELPWGNNEQWFHEAIEGLAGHPTSRGVRYPCPGCGHLTLRKPPPGTDATCEVCLWEDDRVQFRDPDYRLGANRVNLREARENYRDHGKSDPDRRGARQPRTHERPPGL